MKHVILHNKFLTSFFAKLVIYIYYIYGIFITKHPVEQKLAAFLFFII